MAAGLVATVASATGAGAAGASLGASQNSSHSPQSSPPFPSTNVTFVGHGFGPGYGMGQWGAFGDAAQLHWTYHQILVHYYSDTSHPVTTATLSSKTDGEIVKVVIEENDNDPMTVTSPSAFTFMGEDGKTVATIGAGQAARVFEQGKPGALTGIWTLESASTCTSTSWKVLETNLHDPVAVPASLQASAPRSDLLTLCRGDGQDVTYRGRLEGYDYYGANTGDEHLERTLNLIALEQYVSDVTPGESPAGWGTYGGTTGAPQAEPWGFQELEAQAVASRSYVLYEIASGGWYGYADICDDICEYYSAGIKYETPLTTFATRDTSGQYLMQDGIPAPTEYEASSGGYTEALSYWNGQSIFDAVRDVGDAVCIGGRGTLGCNPVHTWPNSVPVAAVEKVFPSVGTLVSVKVTRTDSSGRVTEMEIVGQKSTTTVNGGTFTADFGGFFSTMFAVTDGPGATKSGVASASGTPVAASTAAGAGVPGLQPPVVAGTPQGGHG
ncbi:MAG: SpoIID/LytB domain-containing protein [Acidimicrobiales bacterium]